MEDLLVHGGGGGARVEGCRKKGVRASWGFCPWTDHWSFHLLVFSPSIPQGGGGREFLLEINPQGHKVVLSMSVQAILHGHRQGSSVSH